MAADLCKIDSNRTPVNRLYERKGIENAAHRRLGVASSWFPLAPSNTCSHLVENSLEPRIAVERRKIRVPQDKRLGETAPHCLLQEANGFLPVS